MSESTPSPSSSAAPVAVLGAGLLGAAMAARLGERGHDVRLWNRSAERAARAADGADGVRAVEDLAEAVDGAAVVLTVLRDGEAVADVAGRFLPLLGGAGDGPVWVQASTVGPRAAGELRAQADAAGAAFLDAPVSGSTDPARRGALTWLVAGDAAVLDRARPVLDDLGQRVQHVGGAEEASALKLVVNAWMTGATAVMADALALAERLGTDPGALREVLDGGPLGMPYALGKAAMMTSGEYPAGFPAELALKDLDLAADGGALPGALEPVRERLRAVADGGRGREDVAVLAEALPARG